MVQVNVAPPPSSLNTWSAGAAEICAHGLPRGHFAPDSWMFVEPQEREGNALFLQGSALAGTETVTRKDNLARAK